MMLLALLLGGLAFIAALVLFVKAVRGLQIAARVAKQPTVSVAAIAEGPVEISGTVSAVGDPLVSLSGERCVAAKTIVMGRKGTGKNSSSTGRGQILRKVPCRLTDRTGVCRLDLESSEIVGERMISKAIDVGSLPNEPWLLELVPEGSDNVTIEETVVTDGALVLASGEGEQPEIVPGGGGYRGGAMEWKVTGKPHRLLLLCAFGQTRLLLSSVVPALAMFGCSVYLAGLGWLIVAIALG
jgi:hypothetical protein